MAGDRVPTGTISSKVDLTGKQTIQSYLTCLSCGKVGYGDSNVIFDALFPSLSCSISTSTMKFLIAIPPHSLQLG